MVSSASLDYRADSRRCQAGHSSRLDSVEVATADEIAMDSIFLWSSTDGEGAEEEDFGCLDEECSIYFRQGAFRTFSLRHRFTDADCSVD